MYDLLDWKATFVAVLLGFALPVNADVCDNIDALASDWWAIADDLERTADEELGDLDIQRLERDVNDLLAPTEKLGRDLVELGNSAEESLGNDLLDVAEKLRDVEAKDLAAFLVDRIDDIVDSLDDVVDFCDDVSLGDDS